MGVNKRFDVSLEGGGGGKGYLSFAVAGGGVLKILKVEP